MAISNNIQTLAEALKATPEFSKLKQAKAAISKKPEIKRELEDFNQSQKQLLSGKLSASEAENRLKQLNTRFAGLSKIPEVDSYLKALNDFNRMVSKVYEDINRILENSL